MRSLLLLSLLCLPGLLWAQEEAAGFRNLNKAPEWFLGGSFSPDLAFAFNRNDDINRELDGIFGFHAGLRLSVVYPSLFTIETGLLVRKGGYRWPLLDNGYQVIHPNDPVLLMEQPVYDFVSYSMILPVMLGKTFALSEKVNFGIVGGVYGGWQMARITILRDVGTENPQVVRRDSSSGPGPFVAGALGRAFFQLRASQWWVLQLGPEFRVGLRSLSSESHLTLNSIGLHYAILYSVKN